jgi:hypothetical protein
MSESKLFIVSSSLLAFVGLALALVNDLGLVSYLGVEPSVTGILALALATTAFFVSVRKISFVVSGCLIAQGTADVFAALAAGAAIGVPFGAWVLALGLAKAAISARSFQKRRTQDIAHVSAFRKAQPKRAIAKITIIIVLAAAIAISGAAAAYYFSSNSSSASSSCNTTMSSTAKIFITSGASSYSNAPGYSPDNTTIVLGVNSTVTWKNDDSVHHTVTTSSAPSGGLFDS